MDFITICASLDDAVKLLINWPPDVISLSWWKTQAIISVSSLLSSILLLCCVCHAVDANLSYLFSGWPAPVVEQWTSRTVLHWDSRAGRVRKHTTPRKSIHCSSLPAEAQDATSKFLCVVSSCRETNMKVRQSVSVTAELGDPNNLASFNGEKNSPILLSVHLSDRKVNGFQSAPKCMM